MNLNKLMKEMQKVQVETEKAQNELNDMTFEGVSGGGAVTIKLTGKYKVIGIELSDDALKDSDKEMLQDMIKVALDDVLKKIDEVVKQLATKAMSGIAIPGMPSF